MYSAFTNVLLALWPIRINEPSGRAVLGVGLGPLACWNCGPESRWGIGFFLL
jgi:hypothetical protein